MLTVYLGGPISGCTHTEMKERRNFLKNQLQGKFEFLDPTDWGLFSEGRPAMDVVKMDKEAIDRSDVVVIDAWKTSVGTSMEMMYADMTGKATLLIHEGTVINPWYQAHASIHASNIEVAAILLAELGPEHLRSYTIITDEGRIGVPKSLLDLAVKLDTLAHAVHTANENFWIDLKTGLPKDRNYGETLMLCVGELSESMEAHRKGGKNDDHLPNRPGRDTEIMDCVIRLLDLIGGYKMDCDIFAEKMAYNAIRKDHKLENRKASGGKKC